MAGVTMMSLCDEVKNIVLSGELSGCSEDDGDEPAGDSFNDRCRKACGDDYWIDINDVGDCVEEGVEEGDADPDDDGDDEGEIEVDYGHYADYCKLPLAARAQLVRGLRMTILEMFRFSDSEWNPSDQIIIECIKQRDHMSAKELRRWLYSQYELTQEYLRDTQKKMERDLANNTEVKIVPAQSGGYIARKRAVRRLENKSKYRKWCIGHNDFDGNGNRSPDRHKVSNSTNQTCERRNTRRGRNATIRRDAETYFGFAGTGETFDEFEYWDDQLQRLMEELDPYEEYYGYDYYLRDVHDELDELDDLEWLFEDWIPGSWRPVSRTSHRLLMSGSWDAPMYDMSQFYCDTDGDDYDDESWSELRSIAARRADLERIEHSHNPSGACCMEERVPDPDDYIFANYTGPDNPGSRDDEGIERSFSFQSGVRLAKPARWRNYLE